MKQLAILAGGMGRRLRERLGDLPKPMIPVLGKPLLEHQVELARRHGFTELLLFVCYKKEDIERHFGDGRRFGVAIRYIVEDKPLSTAGAVLAGFEALADRFAVLYGDVMINVDLDRMWRAHGEQKADATLLLHPNDHPFDSDLVEVDEGGWIKAFHNRPHQPGVFRQNLVNAGLYVLEKAPLQKWAGRAEPLDFGKDLFPQMLASGGRLYGYNSPEYIKDIGTPDRYDRISAETRSGVVERSTLEKPQRAVFLDRDGTLNKEIDGVRSPDQLELLPGTGPAVAKLNHAGFRVVVISNQPLIAKGFCREGDVEEIHRKLETLLGLEHAFVDRIYYCPHHPEKGFAGERPELKMDCSCRKPKTGMIERAVRELNIDLKSSWFVGDTTTDVQTARNAGVRAVLVRTGYGGADKKQAVQPDYTFDDLLQAVQFIVSAQ